jgi:hypothetical protein
VPAIVVAIIAGLAGLAFKDTTTYLVAANYVALASTLLVIAIFVFCIGAEVGADSKIFNNKHPMTIFAWFFIGWLGLLALLFCLYLPAKTLESIHNKEQPTTNPPPNKRSSRSLRSLGPAKAGPLTKRYASSSFPHGRRNQNTSRTS